MVDVVDAQQTLTITLIQEGMAAIINVSAPPNARPGDVFTVTVSVRNDGSDDTIFAVLYDNDTGEVIGARQETILASGSSADFSWDITMPEKDLNIRIDAGHVE
jgi:hypothetical protein